MELRNAVASQYAISLPGTAVFDHPTPAALAAFVAGRMAPVHGDITQERHSWAQQPQIDQIATEFRSRATVAITACSVQFPGANDTGKHSLHFPQEAIHVKTRFHGKCLCDPCAGLHQFWANLVHGADLQAPPPLQRWDTDRVYTPEASSGGIYARFGCHLAGLEAFDAIFFRLPRSEALALDPHARLLLRHTQVHTTDPL